MCENYVTSSAIASELVTTHGVDAMSIIGAVLRRILGDIELFVRNGVRAQT